MERIRTALLVAAAAIISVPTLAAAQDHDRHQDRRGGGHEFSRPDTGGQRQHGDRGQRGPRPAPQARPSAQPAVQAPQRNFSARPDVNRGNRGQFSGARPQDRPRQDYRQRDGNDNRGRNFAPGTPRQYGAPGYTPTYNNGYRANDRRDRDNRHDADNRRNWNNRADYGRQNWNNNWNNRGRGDWRNDRRYDWRSYRNQHRDLFRGHRYVPPRGYSHGYRLFSPGLRIDPFFYGQGYWLSDPWEYRLPPVYGTYRWVRYYDDVLLIDISSGIVVDVIPNFFL